MSMPLKSTETFETKLTTKEETLKQKSKIVVKNMLPVWLS